MTTRPVVVLVVEDEPLLRMMAVDIVEGIGVEAVEAASAEQAVSILENRPDIRIVFTDINMPNGVDGLKLAVHIRDRWPPIELIIVSGKREPCLDEIPARGVFFSKPYRPTDIKAALHRFAA